MTEVFDEKGTVHPVTVIETGKLVVTRVKKSSEKDGYDAVQLGFGTRKVKNINKAQQGQFKDLGNFKKVKEFRTEGESELKVGDAIESSIFAEGDTVEVSAISKGKGFQGVIKRHGFKGGPRSHGQKHSERAPGSIGTAGIQRVIKGMRMGGRMGNDRVTVKNLKVIKIDPKNNVIMISGAIPGRRGTLVEIKG